jgi:uncharacterized membrane protein
VSIKKKRIVSIDVLRGIAILFMALDHTRDFFGPWQYDYLDINHTSLSIFFTRFITHFCAPAFILLAGVSITLMRKKFTDNELSIFLIKRGLFIILLEVTWISLSWQFAFYNYILLQVMWVIGMSMVIMAIFIRFPVKFCLLVSLLIIFGHNLLDPYNEFLTNNIGWFASWLTTKYTVVFSNGFKIITSYSVIPWFGVMLFGFSIGSIFKQEENSRRRNLLFIGLSFLILFVVLRLTNSYGEVNVFKIYNSSAKTIISFFNVLKYPPSLHFCCLTLGVSFMLLYILDFIDIGKNNMFLVFGSVPMFFYLLHIPLIHLLSIIFSHLYYHHPANWFHFGKVTLSKMPKDYTLNLYIVYGVWIFIILIFYPLCRWYRTYKQNHDYKILTYL